VFGYLVTVTVENHENP